jgi:hypothetical protein
VFLVEIGGNSEHFDTLVKQFLHVPLTKQLIETKHRLDITPNSVTDFVTFHLQTAFLCGHKLIISF